LSLGVAQPAIEGVQGQAEVLGDRGQGLTVVATSLQVGKNLGYESGRVVVSAVLGNLVAQPIRL
jgi:hypothetical protein